MLHCVISVLLISLFGVSWFCASTDTQPNAITFQNVHLVGNTSQIIFGREMIYVFPQADKLISSFVRFFGNWEQPMIDNILKLSDLVSQLNNAAYEKASSMYKAERVFFDIGANVGSWAIPMAKHIRASGGGQLYAFEAVQETYWSLCATIAVNGMSNIVPINKALGRTKGSIKTPILIPGMEPYNIGGISLLRSEGLSSNEFLRETALDTLDNLFHAGQISCPELIKMDVEMYELNILRGGRELLKKCRPVLFLELDCYALTKSVILLLDHLDYESAWTLLPPFYLDDSVFHGRSWRDVPNPMLKVVLEGTSMSLTAVPREYAAAMRSDQLFKNSMLPALFDPNSSSGSRSKDDSGSDRGDSSSNEIATYSKSTENSEKRIIYAQDYNLTACVEQSLCFAFASKATSGTACAGMELNPDDINFWQTLL